MAKRKSRVSLKSQNTQGVSSRSNVFSLTLNHLSHRVVLFCLGRKELFQAFTCWSSRHHNCFWPQVCLFQFSIFNVTFSLSYQEMWKIVLEMHYTHTRCFSQRVFCQMSLQRWMLTLKTMVLMWRWELVWQWKVVLTLFLLNSCIDGFPVAVTWIKEYRI